MSKADQRRPWEDLVSIPSLGAADILPISNRSLNPAEWMYERIVRSINTFEKQLDQEHEVGARLVTFGVDFTFHIDDVGYWGPDIIIFYGFDKNNKNVQLIQHITQLSVLLIAVDKKCEKPRRIGYKLMEKIEDENG